MGAVAAAPQGFMGMQASASADITTKTLDTDVELSADHISIDVGVTASAVSPSLARMESALQAGQQPLAVHHGTAQHTQHAGHSSGLLWLWKLRMSQKMK